MSYDHWIIGSDWNTILDLNKDKRENSINYHNKATALLNEYISENFLVDIWWLRYPDKFRATWLSKRPILVMESLDYFLISSSLTDIVNIIPGFKSDHSIPTIAITLSRKDDRGKGYWKMYANLLEDLFFIKKSQIWSNI